MLADFVGVLVAEGVFEDVCDCEGEALPSGVSVADGDSDADCETLGVTLLESDTVGERDMELDSLSLGVGVSLAVAVAEAVMDCVLENDSVLLGVRVSDLLFVRVLVGVFDIVGVSLGVTEAEPGDSVTVGLTLMVPVSDSVTLMDADSETVGVRDNNGVVVDDAVSDGVSVGDAEGEGVTVSEVLDACNLRSNRNTSTSTAATVVANPRYTTRHSVTCVKHRGCTLIASPEVKVSESQHEIAVGLQTFPAKLLCLPENLTPAGFTMSFGPSRLKPKVSQPTTGAAPVARSATAAVARPVVRNLNFLIIPLART